MVDEAQPFHDMANVIQHNEGKISAAYVICAPGSNAPISSLILDTEKNPIAFWTMLKSLAEEQIALLVQQEQQRTAGWGGLR